MEDATSCYTPSHLECIPLVILNTIKDSPSNYQPQSFFLMLKKDSPCRPLVKISARFSLESTFWIWKAFPTCSLNQWYLTAMNLEVGVSLGHLATWMAPWLSSNTVELVTNSIDSEFSPSPLMTSLTSSLKGSSSRKDCKSATYYACSVERALSCCSFDTHKTGHAANVNTNPVQDLETIGSLGVSTPQSPAKLAST